MVGVTTDGDSITAKWYEKIYDRWTSENRSAKVKLIPITQYHDHTLKETRGKAPTIDFCFKAWGEDESYFGAECKRLDSRKNKSIHEYVDNGVKRFTTGKYSSKCSVSAMIGYVQQGLISDIVAALSLVIIDADTEQNLVRVMTTSDPEYKSIHRRPFDLPNITLHHLFFDFSFKS